MGNGQAGTESGKKEVLRVKPERIKSSKKGSVKIKGSRVSRKEEQKD